MCMLGASRSRSVIPRRKAIRTYKRVARRMGSYGATAFSDTWFREDNQQAAKHYRAGHSYATVAPTRGRLDGAGNERGFWVWSTAKPSTQIGTHTMDVLIWGIVIQHQLGYRAQFMKVLKIRRQRR